MNINHVSHFIQVESVLLKVKTLIAQIYQIIVVKQQKNNVF